MATYKNVKGTSVQWGGMKVRGASYQLDGSLWKLLLGRGTKRWEVTVTETQERIE